MKDIYPRNRRRWSPPIVTEV